MILKAVDVFFNRFTSSLWNPQLHLYSEISTDFGLWEYGPDAYYQCDLGQVKHSLSSEKWGKEW